MVIKKIYPFSYPQENLKVNIMKMYYFYGLMGSSKTAMALMKKFTFEEHGKKVLLAKPAVDLRDGENILKSRIGLESEAIVLSKREAFQEKIYNLNTYDVIITDESQFFTENQIEELRRLADRKFIVMCYGLKTDFMSRLFEGSKRLLELADCIREIPTPCSCGKKAILNLKINGGEVVTEGEQIDLGGDEKYLPMCHFCYSASFLAGKPLR